VFGIGLGLESGRGVIMKASQSTQIILSNRRIAFFFAAVLIFSGCSAVKFSTSGSCNGDSNCVSQDGSQVYDGKLEVKGGKVDVLIVDDNSASMSFEQAHLAQRFSNFVQDFDDKFIDYRIGITTTDISSDQNAPRTVNQNGALQDGHLVAFSDGEKFLTPTSGSADQKNQMFSANINRPETLSCEQFMLGWSGSRDTAAYSQAYYNSCPSTDERGVYAANLVVQNNPDGFIRDDADLAIIFLADEDERSQLYWNNTPGFELADFDKATTLVSQVKTKYPQKKFTAHAIIVKDPSCLAIQNAQMGGIVNGSYGWDYYNTTTATGGIAGDICASDYTAQLDQIYQNIQSQIVDKADLKCSGSAVQLLAVTYSDGSTSSTGTIVGQTVQFSNTSITGTVVGSVIQFSSKLPTGSTVTYKYKCTNGAT
jgi:hypothetical protein